jgi:hypothetical protein
MRAIFKFQAEHKIDASVHNRSGDIFNGYFFDSIGWPVFDSGFNRGSGLAVKKRGSLNSPILYILVLLQFFAIPDANGEADGFSFGNLHYRNHVLLAYGGVLSGYYTFRSQKKGKPASAVSSFLIVAAAGIGYAFLQKQRDSTYSITGDAIANSIGAAAGTLFVLKIDF